MSEAAESATANASRGEHLLKLGGKSYRLRPSYGAVEAAETKTGVSLLSLVRLLNTADLSLRHLGIVVAELIRAGAESDLDKHVSAQGVAELIYEEGAPMVMARITSCLADAASGGRKASGEAKPVVETAAS